MTALNNSRPDHLPRLWCLLIFAALVLFRLVCLLDFVSSPFFVPAGGDRALYHDLALRVFRGEWFPDVITFMPLYPVLLGLLYKIIGAPNLAAAAFCQVMLEGATGILVMLLARRHYGRGAALAAGGLYVFFGAPAAYALVTMPVSLGLFWIALTAVAADKWQASWTFRRAVLLGLLLGCGGQILASFWLMVLPFAVWIALSGLCAASVATDLKVLVGPPLVGAPYFSAGQADLPIARQNRPAFASKGPTCGNSCRLWLPNFIMALLVILAAASASLPSLIHNYRIEKRLAPVSVHGGLNLYLGNNPDSTGYGAALPGLRTSAGEMTADSIKLAGRLAGRPLGGAEASRFWTKKAFDFWRAAPAQALVLLANKIHRAVSVRDFDDIGLTRVLPGMVRPLNFGFVSFGVIWICACIGLMFSSSPLRGKAPFWIMGLSIVAGMLATFVTARYRLPLALLLLPVAGGGVIKFAIFFRHILDNSINWRASACQRPSAFGTFSIKSRWMFGLAGILLAIIPHSRPDTEAVDNINRAVYLCRAGMTDEALLAAGTAVAVNPASAEAWFIIGNVHVARTNYPAALESYERALGLQANRPDALFNAGFVLEQLDRPKEAGECYRQVVALEPRHAAAWLGLALTARALGDEQSARSAIEKAAEIAGRDHPQIAEFYRTP